ncbi:MAG: archaeosine biosynthesis radical SAM protein RaSEA [Candidatus Heimdallarchaeota archaeon]|nr:archaeosine biosynthesis radical SAM protein RaSEA [Candidatus Heimdallarchaeota archaeon]
MKINPALSSMVREIRENSLKERQHSRKIVNWVEDHRLPTGAGKALVLILPTRGCSWALSKSGGCSICGYIYDNPLQPDYDIMLHSFKEILTQKIEKDLKYSLKLFTSGSFLDTREVPLEIQKEMMKEAAKYDQIEEIVLESRPEYVTESVLDNIAEHIEISKIEIAIGLESANNAILQNSINKGFFWEDFVKATNRIKDKGARVKAYLLFKPPFISEFDSINDILESVSKVADLGVNTVSINAMSIHRGTFLSQLFEKQLYRTPWLWSLLHLCQEIKQKFPDMRLICDVVAGGSERGAHNCGECDKEIISILKKFVLNQDSSALKEEVTCSCKTEWRSFLFSEKISNSEILDIYR